MSSRVRASLGQLGFRKTVAKAWTRSTSLGLRCDLARLPERRPAKVPLTMTIADSAEEAGLTAEVQQDSSNLDAAERVALCSAGVRRLYVARDPEGNPCYVQWLIGPEDHAALERVHPGLFPKPEPGQVLLEGAYTFSSARGIGAMADGMHQLLEIARDEGASEAFTYVSAEYPPAIRGCEKVGFTLDHVRVSKRRLFWRSFDFRAPDQDAFDLWARATA